MLSLNHSSPSLVHVHSITNIDLIINGRNDGSVTHEVPDADKDMDSGDMLAAADRTSIA